MDPVYFASTSTLASNAIGIATNPIFRNCQTVISTSSRRNALKD
jgi:hypothetical protein